MCNNQLIKNSVVLLGAVALLSACANQQDDYGKSLALRGGITMKLWDVVSPHGHEHFTNFPKFSDTYEKWHAALVANATWNYCGNVPTIGVKSLRDRTDYRRAVTPIFDEDLVWNGIEVWANEEEKTFLLVFTNTEKKNGVDVKSVVDYTEIKLKENANIHARLL